MGTMGSIKKYLPFVAVALVVLYFRSEILKAMPAGVQKIFGTA